MTAKQVVEFITVRSIPSNESKKPSKITPRKRKRIVVENGRMKKRQRTGKTRKTITPIQIYDQPQHRINMKRKLTKPNHRKK